MELYLPKNSYDLHFELSSLEKACSSASQSLILWIDGNEQVISGNSLLHEAKNKIIDSVDILTRDAADNLLSIVTQNKKFIKGAQEWENKCRQEGFSQNAIQDAQFTKNLYQYRLYELSSGLREIREELGLTLTRNDITDARHFKDNWALFIRGTGVLSGPPWEPIEFIPLNHMDNDGKEIPQEENTLEISLAYLGFHTFTERNGKPDCTSIHVYSAPLVTIDYSSKTTVSVIADKDRKLNYYRPTNNELFGNVISVKEPLRYQLTRF